MQNANELWDSYHNAMAAGNPELARRILRSIQDYKGNPPPPRGGCSKCRKKLY